MHDSRICWQKRAFCFFCVFVCFVCLYVFFLSVLLNCLFVFVLFLIFVCVIYWFILFVDFYGFGVLLDNAIRRFLLTLECVSFCLFLWACQGSSVFFCFLWEEIGPFCAWFSFVFGVG